MKKVFLFVVAAFAAVSLSAEPVQQDISLDVANWGWGWDSSVANEDNKLVGTITGEWGAISTGWGDLIDLSNWDKLVIVIDNITGCDYEWWYLKADLRDEDYNPNPETPNHHMFFELDKSHNPAETNYLVIDFNLQTIPEGFKRDKVKVLAIQSGVAGSFVVSRVFLEKAGETAFENVSLQNNGIRYNMLGQEVDENYKGVVICNGQKMIVR